MKYKKLTGVILKKQNYREADQILTLWTKEAGKVRVLAKSIRLPKSKLSYSLDDLSLCIVDVAGSNLPVLIGARPLKQFRSFRESLNKSLIGFHAAELVLKMTVDEHPNWQAFDLLSDFLEKLDATSQSDNHQLLDKFSLDLLDALGFKFPQEDLPSHETINKFIEYIIERPIWKTKF